MTAPEGVCPLPGGGRCDRCDRRSFRRLPTGLGWRHEACEPPSYRLILAMRAAAMRPREGMTTAGKAWAQERASMWASLQKGVRL